MRSKKLAILAITTMVWFANAQPFALCADGASSASSSKTASPDTSGATDNSDSGSENLALDNIQDVAYTLQRIRQQAINIYVEATRKKVHRYDLNIPSLSTMPSAPLEDLSVYLPLRKAWLVFFIGTMEPLVQILNDHLKLLEERARKAHIPDQSLPEWQGIASDWKTALDKLNKQLDVCATLVDDSSPDNIEVAQAARAIDTQVSTMESILHRASKFLRDNLPHS